MSVKKNKKQKSSNIRVLRDISKRNRKKYPNVVVIGGGTGSYVVLNGLKNHPINLSAIVAMTDSGGSTGRLRDQLGVLPPGDLRQALVALSDTDEIWRKLFAYRFDSGDLDGHNFGNLFISALEKLTGSHEAAIDYASQLLDTMGEVIPVTLSKCELVAEFEDGSVVEGEKIIDESYTKRPRISVMYLSPAAEVNPKAKKAIEEADFIVFTPGDLYTSIIPNLLVNRISLTVKKSKAKKIYFVNLMTKLGQTDGFKASDFVKELERYIGGTSLFDFLVVNNKKIDPDVVAWYKRKENVDPVEDDLNESELKSTKIIRTDLLSRSRYHKSVADRVKRSLIRHDPDKLAKVLIDIFNK